MTTLKQVEDFLALKRVAVVASRAIPRTSPASCGRSSGSGAMRPFQSPQRRRNRWPALLRERQGHPAAVEGALIMTSKKADRPGRPRTAPRPGSRTSGCTAAWLQERRRTAPWPSPTKKGMSTVKGLCPYMFLPGTPAFHAPHRIFKKLTAATRDSAGCSGERGQAMVGFAKELATRGQYAEPRPRASGLGSRRGPDLRRQAPQATGLRTASSGRSYTAE